jgi:uncharacterized OsmC-like protein
MSDAGEPRAAVAVKAEGGRYQHEVEVGGHRIVVDEPTRFGGLDAGPTPYDLLSAALASCTAMTIHFFAARDRLVLPPFRVEVRHQRVHARDCLDCVEGASGRIDRFERRIVLQLPVDRPTEEALLHIAGKCPVDVTLRSNASVGTAIGIDADPSAALGPVRL